LVRESDKSPPHPSVANMEADSSLTSTHLQKIHRKPTHIVKEPSYLLMLAFRDTWLSGADSAEARGRDRPCSEECLSHNSLLNTEVETSIDPKSRLTLLLASLGVQVYPFRRRGIDIIANGYTKTSER
jgi:hypothetical protein